MNARNTNYLGSALLAATTLVVAACSGGGRDGYGNEPPPAPQNTAPTVLAIADRSADQDTVVTVEVRVSDTQTTVASMLTVSAKADGATLFPEDGVELSGTGAARTLRLTPLEAQTGAAMITITAVDPQGLMTTRTFRVAVNARNASAWATMQATLAKSAADPATQLNGATYVQDADSNLLGSYLPPPELIAGVE